MLARRFLLAILWLTLLAVAGGLAMFMFGDRMIRRTMTPSGAFVAPPPASGPDYLEAASWIARGTDPRSPAEWRPADWPPPTLAPRRAAAFFIHPTTYLERSLWNAPLDDRASAERAALFVRSQASAFNAVAEIWAPRYRQAGYGAFLLTGKDATQALDLAYRDVREAFDAFVAAQPAGRPLILAGHSQGSLHLARLVADRRTVLKDRLVAAYVVGWPLSVATDLAAMDLRPCTAPDQWGCLLSWQSFAEPANPSLMIDAYQQSSVAGAGKRLRRDLLCVNPLTGTRGGAAPAAANPGTLVPSADFGSAELTPGLVGARCADGLLLIEGELPPLGPYVLPGNNYHVYDYALFWAAIRTDAQRRLAAWERTR